MALKDIQNEINSRYSEIYNRIEILLGPDEYRRFRKYINNYERSGSEYYLNKNDNKYSKWYFICCNHC